MVSTARCDHLRMSIRERPFVLTRPSAVRVIRRNGATRMRASLLRRTSSNDAATIRDHRPVVMTRSRIARRQRTP